MAQVFGRAGRNAAEAVHQRTKRIVASGSLAIAIVGCLSGYVAGAVFPIRDLPLPWIFLIIAVLSWLMWRISKWACDQMDSIDRDRLAWRKGVVGEAIVGATLAELPDDFVVVNDISTRHGNIDHVVIGPTGVYLIDAKNWRGTVRSNGDGELELNGKVPAKPAVKSLLNGVMDFQSKLKAFTAADHFVRGLLVFPNAYVQANFGSTRQIHCLRTERLTEYLQDERFSRKLRSSEIDQFTFATLELAGIHDRSNDAH
jgi:hypothetical protein